MEFKDLQALREQVQTLRTCAQQIADINRANHGLRALAETSRDIHEASTKNLVGAWVLYVDSLVAVLAEVEAQFGLEMIENGSQVG